MLDIKKGSLKSKTLNFILRFKSITYKKVHLKRHNLFVSTTSIGKYTRINGNFKCKGGGKLTIGAYCALGENIKVITSNHNLKSLNLQVHLNKKLGIQSEEIENKGIQIGNNVWIGDNVIILPGVNIGDCAIIGAGSIVTKDVTSFSINAGNPSKLIRNRFKSTEIIELLKDVKWWKWSEEKIQLNKSFLASNFNNMSIEGIKNEISSIK